MLTHINNRITRGKNTKNPDLPTFSGEIPTPKGEVEYDNFVFQLQMLRSSYTDDAIRNAIVASVRMHAKIAIRAIGYGFKFRCYDQAVRE